MRRRWLGLVGLVGWSLLWQQIQGWRPTLWDGYRWVAVDSCVWEVAQVLPQFSQAVLAQGDRLLRIDYQPVCDRAELPPDGEPGRLYVYEVLRQGRQPEVVFVEGLSPFPYGWPATPEAYRILRLLGALVGGIGLFFLLISLEWWRWEGFAPRREGLSLLVAVALAGGGWFFWEQPAEAYRQAYVAATLVGIGGWGFLYGLRRSELWMLLLLGPPFFIVGQPGLAAFAVKLYWGLPVLFLPGRLAWLYGGVWGGWVAFPHPLLQMGLIVGVLGAYASPIWQTLRLVEPEVWMVRLGAMVVGLTVLLWRWVDGVPMAVLWGGLALVGALGGAEGLRRFLRLRQRRVRLLEESLPRLWEHVNKSELLAFVRHVLSEYAQLAEMAIHEAAEVAQGARPWLRRSGVPFPLAECPVNWMPDAAVPLPAYGWLLLKEGKRRLGPEDIRRLLPFAAGVSIALRHLALFEAAHEARLAALRGQLSPHFLFNALNTLQALIGENPALAESLMSQLGALLRRSLSHARQVTVPLEEELALVADYLSVEQQRFGSRLRLVWQVPATLPTVQVPPFCIQILAENAIKHAVSRMSRPVTVTLSVQVRGDEVEISLTDDGPGIDLSRIQASIGLSNLLLRLEQLYGGRATLQAERLEPGTRVTIRLPLLAM